MTAPKTLMIDGTKYVQGGSVTPVAHDNAVIVRANSGVFFGYLTKKDGNSVELTHCRQVYSWDSAGLSEKSMTCPDLATNGVGSGSKLSMPAAKAVVDQVGAVFYMTEKAIATVVGQGWACKK